MIKIAINKDSRVLAEIAVQMWDSHTVDELETEFLETLNDKQSAFFIKNINDCITKSHKKPGTFSVPGSNK